MPNMKVLKYKSVLLHFWLPIGLVIKIYWFEIFLKTLMNLGSLLHEEWFLYVKIILSRFKIWWKIISRIITNIVVFGVLLIIANNLLQCI
jgi:hypothetical protein